MPTDTKRPAKRPAKARPAAKSARLIQAEVVPKRQAWATPSEKAQYCAMRATGTPAAEAYRTLRPETSREGCASQGTRWDAEMADEIAKLKATASQAAALAHGVNAAYLIGHAKAILETPISALGPDNIYCRKYKVTETMTDAGPKTTIEVEKDSPLAAVQAMAKMTGLEGKPAEQPAEGQGQAGLPTVRDLIAQIIRPGSPIVRRLAEKKAES